MRWGKVGGVEIGEGERTGIAMKDLKGTFKERKKRKKSPFEILILFLIITEPSQRQLLI